MKKAAIVKIIISAFCALLLTAWLVLGIISSYNSNLDFGFNFNIIGISVGNIYDETGYTMGNAVFDEQLTFIDIDWNAGNIDFAVSEDGKVHISEDYAGSDPAMTMRVKCENGKLYVKAVKSGYIRTININNLKKNLRVEIPSGATLVQLIVDTGAGNMGFDGTDINMADIDMGAGNVTSVAAAIDKLDIDMGAGNLELNGDLGTVDVDMGAGNIEITGSLRSLEADAGAGDVDLVLTNSPDKIDVDIASGDITVTLPADCPGFDAEIDSAVGRISVTGFEGANTRRHEAYYGNGHTEIDVDSATGELRITQAE